MDFDLLLANAADQLEIPGKGISYDSTTDSGIYEFCIRGFTKGYTTQSDNKVAIVFYEFLANKDTTVRPGGFLGEFCKKIDFDFLADDRISCEYIDAKEMLYFGPKWVSLMNELEDGLFTGAIALVFDNCLNDGLLEWFLKPNPNHSVWTLLNGRLTVKRIER